MARQKAIDGKIQVTRGFVTEFTPLGFPQEAAIDIDNCIIDTDGSIRRRPGIDVEQPVVLTAPAEGILLKGNIQTLAFSTHLWEFVNNSGTLNIIVQQIGLVLQFYSQLSPVSSQFLGEITLADHAVDRAQLGRFPMETASGLGALFVVSAFMEPVKITYDGTTFTSTELILQQRDFEGVDDGLAIDERPASLTKEHYYNLTNQGWTDKNLNLARGAPANTGICNSLPAALVDGFWPSNADIMTVGIVTDSAGDLVFDPVFVRDAYLGNTPAPKGHYILDAFNKEYSVVSDCATAPADVVTALRPQAVTFHQGRVFYSSPEVQGRGNGIFYSQQLLNDDRAAKCFQEADPTAAEINDLIATDGGFLPTPGVGQVYSLQEFGNGVVMLASNGVWYLTGADVSSAMTATNLRVDKVHSSGALSASSVVHAEGQLYYFGIEGIMQIALSETGGAIASNITQNSIQQFYVNISASAREVATTVYVPEQRKIYWAYRDTAKDDTQVLRNANRVLVLDLDVKGFYKFSIGEDSANDFPEVIGLTTVNPIAAGEVTNEIVTESDLTPVTLTDASTLTQDIIADAGQVSEIKIATLVFDSGEYKLTFSTLHDRSFTDWRDFDPASVGLAMSSFVEFAEFNLGAPHTRGRPTYIHSYFSKDSKNLLPGGYYELPPL